MPNDNIPPLNEPLDLAAYVDDIASRAARLSPPSPRNPHRFHEDKSDIVAELRKLSRALSASRGTTIPPRRQAA